MSFFENCFTDTQQYTVPLGTDPLGNIIRLDNSLNSFPERITAAENELATLHQ